MSTMLDATACQVNPSMSSSLSSCSWPYSSTLVGIFPKSALITFLVPSMIMKRCKTRLDSNCFYLQPIRLYKVRLDSKVEFNRPKGLQLETSFPEFSSVHQNTLSLVTPMNGLAEIKKKKHVRHILFGTFSKTVDNEFFSGSTSLRSSSASTSMRNHFR